MTLTVKDQQIHLDPFLVQTSKLGREFKLIGIKIDYEAPPVFINKMYIHCTYYFFKYLDDNSYFGLYFDQYDKIKHKLTHQEVLELCK